MRRLTAPLLVGAAALSVVTARWSALHWGATTEESRESLPGDEHIADPGLVATRAITIEALPEAVWPWVVQIGADRGGFYSYDVLENLLGCRLRSADSVVSEWQQLEPGDLVRLHPQVALTVVAVDPNHSLVLRSAPPSEPGAASGAAPPDGVRPGESTHDAPYDFTWAFVLRRHPHAATRLIARERFGYTHRWSPLLVEPLSVASSLMSQKMLRGIRDRAERQASASA
ncbi:SRPBCC family protein [Terrabacter terrigena]|uniref:SRPBCC family protein n=1 Tax=Terrabacter terrigena TaxID=574718 RepID=A0ABW3N5Q1_9MICO